MISQKVGPFFLDFTESWGGEQTGGGKTKLKGAFAPLLHPPGAATDVEMTRQVVNNERNDAVDIRIARSQTARCKMIKYGIYQNEE